MTTLVTGATGNTGRHVVAELVRRGERVRALTRDPVAAAGKLPAEAELVAGTHTEPHKLDAALQGVDRLHVTVTAGLAEAGPELVRRAVEAGVRRFTVVWGGAVGPVEKAVRGTTVFAAHRSRWAADPASYGTRRTAPLSADVAMAA
ncbi:SDR family oxidoreductase [Nocardia sp. NPDC004573]